MKPFIALFIFVWSAWSPVPSTSATAISKMPPPTLEASANAVIRALAQKNWTAVATFMHPHIGVRFSPYAFVQEKQDVVLNRLKVRQLGSNQNILAWGKEDATGLEIRLKPAEYYAKYVYNKDFVHGSKGVANQQLSQSTTVNNIPQVYPLQNHAYIEYHVPNSGTTNNWASLRLVFRKVNERIGIKWYLVGIVHDQWTT